MPELNETPGKPANDSKPVGVTIIRYATLLFSLGFGFYSVLFFGLLGAGGAGDSQFHVSVAATNLSLLLFVTAFFSFLIFVALNQPKKGNWYCVIGFWLFILLSYVPVIFAGDPFFIGAPTPKYLIKICLVPIIYSSVCLIYFQIARVKEYFHLKRPKGQPLRANST